MNSLRSLRMAGVLLAGVSGLIASTHAEDSVVIKEGMKDFHKGNTAVIKKVIAGEASEEEIKKLQAFYKAIGTEKPPLGDEASWKEKTGALVKALDAVAAKEPDGVAKLKEASNCKACHSVHKPK